MYAPEAARAAAAKYTCSANCALPSCYCPQQTAPGGLAREDVPQFIVLTHDDATNAAAVAALASITKGHKNAGATCDRAVPATLFTSGAGTDCAAVKAAWAAGSEIAAHTWSHLALGADFAKTPAGRTLEGELLDVRAWLAEKCGIPLADIVGHRSPFLVQAPNTREVLHKAGFLYDSTINEHWPMPTSPGPGQRLWPYTWDSGTPQDCSYVGGQVCVAGESYPGLWEIPMWTLQSAQEYPEGAYIMDPEGDVFGLLKLNFDWAYAGNKSPLPIYIHGPWITPANAAAASKFLGYALAKPNVFAVTMHQVIQWMQNPIPASQVAAWLGCAPGGRAEAKKAAPTAPPPAAPAAAAEPAPAEAATVTAVSEAPAPAPADGGSPAPVGLVAGAAAVGVAALAAIVAAAVLVSRRHAAAAAAAAEAAGAPAGGDPESPVKPAAPAASRVTSSVYVDARSSASPAASGLSASS